MMNARKIQLSPEKHTYLATLYGKALDAGAKNPILGDSFAAEAVANIDFDFKALKLPRGAEISLPSRALHFDTWTREFLAAHPEATVLHLGCGLDTRVFRINPGPKVRWIDVDLPDVIAVREQLYPPREGYRMIASSVTDHAWLEAIAGDTPVLGIAEGLMMYLPEKDGLALLRRMTGHFPGGQFAFDAYSAGMTRLVTRLAAVRNAKVELVWGIDNPRDLEKAIPGFRLVDEVSFLMMPELVARLATSRSSRALQALMGKLAFYRKLVRHLRYDFG